MKKKLVAMLGIGCMFISAVSLNGCGNAQVEEELVESEGEDNQASEEETEVITENKLMVAGGRNGGKRSLGRLGWTCTHCCI